MKFETQTVFDRRSVKCSLRELSPSAAGLQNERSDEGMTQASLGQSQGHECTSGELPTRNRNKAARTTGSRGEDACFSSQFRKKVDFVTGCVPWVQS